MGSLDNYEVAWLQTMFPDEPSQTNTGPRRQIYDDPYVSETIEGRGFTCPIQEQHRVQDVSQEKRKTPPNDTTEQSKRPRALNWEGEETKRMLKGRLKVLMRARRRGEPVPNWSKQVSQLLYDTYGYDRSAESCTDRWDTVLRPYKAISEYDSKIISGTQSDSISRYFVMTQDERSKHGTLPRAFPEDWYDLIENIVLVESDNDLVKKTLRLNKGTKRPIKKNYATSTSTSTILSDTSPSQVTTSANTQPVAPIMSQACLQQHQVYEVFNGATVGADNDLIDRIAPILYEKFIAKLRSENYATPSYNPNTHVATPIQNATPGRYGSQSDFNVNKLSLEHGPTEVEDNISDLILDDGTGIRW